MRPGIPRIASVLLGILILASILLILSRTDSKPFPSVESARPSGAEVFADLLKKQGYLVRMDARELPTMMPDEVAIAYLVIPPSWLSNTDEQGNADSIPARTISDVLREHQEAGGSTVYFTLPPDFDKASVNSANRVSRVETAWYSPEKSYELTVGRSDRGGFLSATREYESYPAWYLKNDAFVLATKSKKGLGVEVWDGTGTLNRFIDKKDNAEFFLNLMTSAAGEHRKLVFVEASFGHIEDPSLLQDLGSWATPAFYQAFLAFLLLVFTLGKSFGAPSMTSSWERGAQEFIVAFSETMRRGRRWDLALRILADFAKQEIRGTADENHTMTIERAQQFPAKGGADRAIQLAKHLRSLWRRDEVK